ncbi:MAG: ribonuclease P [Methanocalculus sp. MSAO_Arc2]|uniref:RNase P subunit p30 family protein n=1 Tax=Methanocalculus sp. MSAO_Arc2 TaxID=2293855 RepID=UPI000FF1CA4A|nr:MAG: ribonuclease P [Methanocalculus sp. MSAO_Arc2]
MTVTDVFIHPYPEGDSTLQRMARAARDAGYDTIVAIDHPECEYYSVSILNGTIVTEGTPKAVHAAVRKKGRGIIGVDAGENSFNRSVIQIPGVHLLTGLHRTQKNSFDHVTARFAAVRKVGVHLDIGQIITCRGHARQKVLARYHELLVLQRKFGFVFAIGSGARSILDQRTVREMITLTSLFGMTQEETLLALRGVFDLFEHSSFPRVVQ